MRQTSSRCKWPYRLHSAEVCPTPSAATALHAPAFRLIAAAVHVLPQLCVGTNFPLLTAGARRALRDHVGRPLRKMSARASVCGRLALVTVVCICITAASACTALGLGLIAPPSICRCTLNAFLLSGITVITVSLRGVYVDMLAKQHVWLTMLCMWHGAGLSPLAPMPVLHYACYVASAYRHYCTCMHRRPPPPSPRGPEQGEQASFARLLGQRGGALGELRVCQSVESCECTHIARSLYLPLSFPRTIAPPTNSLSHGPDRCDSILLSIGYQP